MQLFTVGFAPKEIIDKGMKDDVLNKAVKLQSKIALLKEQLQKTKEYADKDQKEYIDVLLEDLSVKQTSLQYVQSISAQNEILPSQLITIQTTVYEISQELELTMKVIETLEQGIKQNLNKQI